ncbi:DUF624 domain-containing protein [Clostridium baratii]|uniref:Putative integral membrane protein n=1 Tax=Clostridium baratii TaxID=1561 RepID=A0A174T1W4_9CLOT|nr:DUF624 domain-containing protein [Clostridium baratii]CUQ01360.1 putative integral membrane protein [Clostridium baratii]
MQEIFNLDKIFDTFNYIFWFFVLNFFFMLFNIPVISFFLFVGISNLFNYFPLFLVCLIPTVPAFTILLYCMGKLMRTKNLEPINDFVKGFKLNFKQAIVLWSFELLLIFALYSNIRFFTNVMQNTILTCLFAALLILLIAITPFIYILMSRFSMKNLPLIRSAFVLAFTRPLLTISNILLFAVSLVIFEIIPGTSILFIVSIFAFLLIFANRQLLAELEQQSKATN